MTRFYVGSSVVCIDPTKDMIKYAHENLTIANPDYYKKVQLGKWTGNTPEFIHLYAKDAHRLILPFGCIDALWRRYGREYPFERAFASLRPFSYKSRINLYSYQEKAVKEALTQRNGVIVMPCGAGKTQTALEIISRIGGRALWLTHTQDLLNQSMNRAKAVFDCSFDSYGTITSGKINIGEGLTFATVQTMSKIDLEKYKRSFDVIVVDECHKAIGSPTKVMQFYKVVSSLSCRFKFGVTATPKRADGLEKSMFALLGNIIHEVDKEAVKETTCEIVVKKINTDYIPNMDIALAGDGTLNYAGLVDDLTHDVDRFSLVLDTISTLKGGVLVLANRVEYLKKMCDEYVKSQFGKAICLSGSGNSKSAKEERKEALRKLNCGDLDAVFATYQLAKEGLDVPSLRYVVFATPEKDETTVTQAAGRVGRKADGKEYGTVIDFVDNFALLKGWAKKRNGYYKKLQATIIE